MFQVHFLLLLHLYIFFGSRRLWN